MDRVRQLRRENGDLRVALRTAYDMADDLGGFLVDTFETRRMGDDELAMVATGKLVQYRHWQETRYQLL